MSAEICGMAGRIQNGTVSHPKVSGEILESAKIVVSDI